jgi:hypothetical protein
MELKELFEQFDWTKLSYFFLFALPGFVSLKIWALIVPVDARSFKDDLAEAIAFGVLNAGVVGPLVLIVPAREPWQAYAVLVLALVLLPVVWPFVLQRLLLWLSAKGWILNPSRNAWDDVFLRREPYFVIVHLKDGRRIGGYFGGNSFAGLHPTSGHIYLEALWSLADDGKFDAPIPDSKGIILRPEDYQMIELLRVPEESADDR